MTTPNLELTELVAAQAQPHIPINTAFRRLDAVVQLSVLATENDPPGGSPGPADGDVYIVGVAPTGDWVGHEGDLALFMATGWEYLTPRIGWIAYDVDQEIHLQFIGGSPAEWEQFGGGGAVGADPRTSFLVADDFMTTPKTTGPWPWSISTTGTGASVLPLNEAYGEPGHPGVLVVTTGSTSTGGVVGSYGSAAPSGSHQMIALGGGQIEFSALVKFDDAPEAGQQYVARLGVGDRSGTTTTNPTSGIFFEPDPATGVWNYACRLDSSNITQVADSGSLALTAATWHHLRFVVNAAGSSVAFYVDGSLRATIATNVPTVPSTMILRILKTVGNTERRMRVDYMGVSQIFSAARW